ncbi:MAG: hypothetical protein WB792_01990 [Desulfobacterales bacterium]
MKTRTTIAIFIGIMFMTLMGYSTNSDAEVSVRIGINVPLPHVVLHAPPPVVVIPGTYAYYAPDAGMEMFFYHGYWYRPHHNRWYRGRGYNGPWENIQHARVPHALRNLPPDFRRTARRHERIRYADFHKNWKTWEKEKHWDRRANRHEVRNVRHGAKMVIKHSRPVVRDVHHGKKMEIKHDMREARNVRHGGKAEVSHGMSDARDARHGGQKDINNGKHGEKEKYKK